MFSEHVSAVVGKNYLLYRVGMITRKEFGLEIALLMNEPEVQDKYQVLEKLALELLDIKLEGE
jgi:hypothetical protein